MTATAIPTIAVFPEENLTLSEKVEKWVWELCQALEADYQRSYPNSSCRKEFKMQLGRRYWKILNWDFDIDGVNFSESVHAFVDRNTGEVYKPAGWRGPAKIVRYDLRIIKERQECLSRADWAGGYLYVR